HVAGIDGAAEPIGRRNAFGDGRGAHGDGGQGDETVGRSQGGGAGGGEDLHYGILRDKGLKWAVTEKAAKPSFLKVGYPPSTRYTMPNCRYCPASIRTPTE